MNTDLKLFQSFFPENILISDIENSENSMLIKLHSKTKSAICPFCKKESSGLHATHHRKIQDLPVYGRTDMDRYHTFRI